MAGSENPTPVQLIIELARALGMEIIQVAPDSKLYVIRDGGRRAGMIRDEWEWRNAVPPPPRRPQEE